MTTSPKAELSVVEPPAGSEDVTKEIVIRAIEPDDAKSPAKQLAWLGVSVQDVSEALTAQLGLKLGEGLLVDYVSTNSPAAKAELQKHDVLVELDGQMLVDPAQLRKLVQMHQEGDSVKITFYRGGKKQSATAKLVKKNWNEPALDDGTFFKGGFGKLQLKLSELNGLDGFGSKMNGLAQSLGRDAGLDKEKLDLEIKRTMDSTRKAIRDAMRQTQDGQKVSQELALVSKELADLAGGGVDVGKDSTVVVKRDGKSARSIVRTDDSGSYVIVADPDKHLTAHDQHGKLLFDGAIESPEQQQKVPKEVWEKTKPLLEQMANGQ